MAVIIGDNHNLISDFLSLVTYACLCYFVCRSWYDEGYRDGKKSRKENEVKE